MNHLFYFKLLVDFKCLRNNLNLVDVNIYECDLNKSDITSHVHT